MKQSYSPIKCAICGEVTERMSAPQKYCISCRPRGNRLVKDKWNNIHRERVREQQTKRRENNRERFREYANRWARANREIVIKNTHARRARIRGNGGTYSITEINSLFKAQNYTCYYCNKPFFNNTLKTTYHIEHKLPISKGGSNDIKNIVISCPTCNWAKNDKTEEEFIKCE